MINFLWFFRLKCWFKGQIISRIHFSLPNTYKLMCFDRNINGNSGVKLFEWDYWSLHWRKNLTLVWRKCWCFKKKSAYFICQTADVVFKNTQKVIIDCKSYNQISFQLCNWICIWNSWFTLLKMQNSFNQ